MKKVQDDTAITHHDGGTTLTGDATELFRWMHIRAALVLYNRNGMLMTRGATPSHLLKLTEGVTKKTYKNNRTGREQAITDLDKSIQTLRAAIPDVDKRSKPDA